MAQGVVEANIVKEMASQFKNLLEIDLSQARKEETTSITRFMEKEWAHVSKAHKLDFETSPETGVSHQELANIAKALYTVPAGNQLYKKALRLVKERENMFKNTDRLDWGMAELLAYGSLLSEGNEVRLTGQDVERGTFSHRHAILRDLDTEERINLLNNLGEGKAKFEVYNSLLSEYAVLGLSLIHI